MGKLESEHACLQKAFYMEKDEQIFAKCEILKMNSDLFDAVSACWFIYESSAGWG